MNTFLWVRFQVRYFALYYYSCTPPPGTHQLVKFQKVIILCLVTVITLKQLIWAKIGFSSDGENRLKLGSNG